MAVNGFDFGITTEGELIVDNTSHDIHKKIEDELRIQLAYNRIKSITKNWFVDECGADLEILIGRPCNKDTAEFGKNRIITVLTFDELWLEKELYIQSEIVNNTCIKYTIYLRLTQSETEDEYSYQIIAELDLVKGVKVRYGWNPRRR